MSTSALIEILARVRNERRTAGTDVTHTEHELVEAIALTCPARKEHASK